MVFFRKDSKAWVVYALLLILFIIFFKSTLNELVSRWFTSGAYYSQGPFVFIIFFWILIRRSILPKIDMANSLFMGYLFIAGAICAEISGQLISILAFQFFALYLFILGMSFLILGKKFVHRNLPLFLFLLLAIPLPSFILDYITLSLKLATASISGYFISIIYPSTSLYGSTLEINNYLIEVTPACSGMENIFGMVTLLWFIALFQKRRIITALDYIISIPAAILANILRIVIVSILTVNGYGKFALEDFHGAIGVIVFILIFISIMLFNELPDFKNIKNDKGMYVSIFTAEKINLIPLLVIMTILVIGSSAVKFNNSGEKEKYPLVINNIAAETSVWKSRDEKLEVFYYSMLQTDDILMREYFKKNITPGDGSVFLYFIHDKGSRKPFLHRPELCLMGEGYNLIEKNIITLQNVDRQITRMLFVRGDKGLLVYYWYKFNGVELSSYLELQFKMITELERKMNCSMIRLSRIVDPGNVEKGEILLREFAEQEIPVILKI